MVHVLSLSEYLSLGNRFLFHTIYRLIVDTILASRYFVDIHGHTHKDGPITDLYFSVNTEVLLSGVETVCDA